MQPSYRITALQRFARQRLATLAAIVLILMVVLVVLAPLIAPSGPNEQDLRNILQQPLSAGHVLGTDQFGRDVVTLLLYGGRLSFMAVLQGLGLGLLLGLIPGVIAGFVGGKFDWLLMRVIEALMAFPAIMLAVAIVAALGPSLTNAMIAVGVLYAPRVARMARDTTRVISEETFVDAAIGLGLPRRVILTRHVFPHVTSPLSVQASVLAGYAMIIEAGLSFIGLGASPPDASWGTMLSTAFRYTDRAPLLIVWPGLCIMIAVLCFNLVGDGIKDSVGREETR